MSKDIFIRIFFLLCFFLSFFIMFHTFSYSQGNMLIASKVWSDFGAHIPLIRSFSFGFNFPVEYPIFPGEAIHYHFLFYAFVGLLEKLGLPINIALNIPSSIGFFLLLIMLYFFAKQLFSSRAIGILSVIFFLFNGSFSFYYFLKGNPFSISFFQEVVTNSKFYSFAPYYGEGIVSAFWNLNIFTNQRHFAAAFALSLFIIYILLRPVFQQKKIGISQSLLLGIFLGISFYFHIAVFMMTGIVIFLLGILFSQIRGQSIFLLTIAGIIAYPQYLYMNSGGDVFSTVFKPGYLISNELTFSNFIWYWLMNFGIHIVLIVTGFFLSNKSRKKVFLAFFSMFIIGNLFQFSPEMAANHKFFNYFLLIGIMYSAYVILLAWKKVFLRPVCILLFFLLTFSGIIDFFPIVNDSKIILPDFPNNKTAAWIKENTPPESVFLNHTYFFAPESIAGRKVFLGWPYFAWSAGHDTSDRGKTRELLFSSESKKEICQLLKQNNLSYIEVNKSLLNDPDNPPISSIFQDEFYLEYKNENIEIYTTQKSCN